MSPTFQSSLARIFSDLIKADTVIDVDELEKYESFCASYGITKEDEGLACSLSLEEALEKLSSYPQQKKERLLNDCINLSLSDGFCAFSEALLLWTYQLCLDIDSPLSAQVISIPTPEFSIGNQQLLYMEIAYDKDCNSQILQSYRNISNELRLAGFKFVYIPKIASHYRHYNEKSFAKVVNFLAPHLSATKVDKLVEKLSHITTASFCSDQLYHHLGIDMIRDVSPSFLVKIGENYVNHKAYTNFLCVKVRQNVLSTVKILVDRLKNMLSSDAFLIPTIEDNGEQFLYQGFYKQLFDMYTMNRGVESRLLINFKDRKISLPEANVTIKGLRRKEKAFYILLLSKPNGVNFNPPQSAEQLDKYKRYLSTLQADFSRIYGLLGGDESVTPDIGNPEIRRPLISVIRAKIAEFENILTNIDDYSIVKDANGNFSVRIDPLLVKVQTETGEISLNTFLY